MIIHQQNSHENKATRLERLVVGYNYASSPSLISRTVLDTTQLRSLVESAAAVAGAVDLREVIRTAVAMAQTSTGAKYAALGVRNDHGTLEEFIHLGMPAGLAEKVGNLPIGKGLLGTLINHPKTIRVEHLPDHPDFVGFPEHHPPMESFLGVPIRAGDRVFGNFYLTDKAGGFEEADEVLVEALAAVVGSAVSAAKLNDRLRKMALVEDRERIARDLHDAVIQDLFAVGLGLQALMASIEDPAAGRRLDQAISGIDDAIDALRTFIFDLKSVGTSVVDPDTTVRRLVGRIISNTDLQTEILVTGVDPQQAEVFDDALQVLRECVSNAVRHAEATLVRVSVKGVAEGITVVVSDDGKGYDPSAIRRGLGLDNIRERINRRGGTLEIDSQSGTTVRAALLR